MASPKVLNQLRSDLDACSAILRELSSRAHQVSTEADLEAFALAADQMRQCAEQLREGVAKSSAPRLEVLR
ncbi:MAG TPA: hypothetical protein VFQ61_06440 [Polyangiaceae bacterium]|nr:hypothetical protein [Polyangiaceae bacterium]